MVAILLGTGFEEAEAIVPADLLRRAKEKEVTLLGTGEDPYTAACRLHDCLE